MVGGEVGRQLCHDLAPGGCRTSPGRKRGLIRWGLAARISNGTRPQDPGGGAMHLTPPPLTPGSGCGCGAAGDSADSTRLIVMVILLIKVYYCNYNI